MAFRQLRESVAMRMMGTGNRVARRIALSKVVASAVKMEERPLGHNCIGKAGEGRSGRLNHFRELGYGEISENLSGCLALVC
jgi:hypothetical protein